MEQKQTAVEWLVSRLNKEGFAPVVTQEEIEQAKEMEKKQTEKAKLEGYEFGTSEAIKEINKIKDRLDYLESI